ncbi:MAG: GNAT family N-acetyltransferase [Frankia sp.]
MEDVRLVRWTPAQTRARLDEVIRVYKAAFLDVHEADPDRAARDRMAHARRHTERSDMITIAAMIGADQLIGFIYALPGRRGQWWHDVVTSAVSRDVAADWLADCLEIVELHLMPAYQGRGIGRMLLRELLGDAPQRTAALSALEPDGSRARRLYESEGFQPLLSNFPFPGSSTRYAVLAKRLDADRLAGARRL